MKSFKTLALFLPFLFLILSLDIYASSLSPELIQKLKKEGRLEQVVREANLAREKGVWAPNPNPPLKRSVMTTNQVDTIKAVVLLVDFADHVSSRRVGEFDTLLFTKGFVLPTGSLRDYYWENSYQTFEVIGDAYGWFRMPQSYVAYTCTLGYQNGFGSYPYNAQKLVEDAINAADPYVNFANYDYNHDGWVDALFVVHAGEGAEATGDPCDIWSHRWTTSMTITKDGVNMRDYAMEPERRGGSLVDMGVFCHEFGHVLGLPDLYDGDYSSEGLGNWSIMAGGSWNNNGHTPAHFDAWSKYKLGFSTTTQLATNQTDAALPQAETSPISYRLWTSGMGGSQYFMVENRQKIGFDSYLPGEGLLIYHVDEAGSNNTEWCPGDPATPHYRVAVEQADGQYQLEGCYGPANSGDAGDPFPGSHNQRAFDDTTTPSSRNYLDGSTQVAVWNISDSDSAMSANLDVTWSRPCLLLDQFVLNDSIYGNGNGLPEPGEKIRLYFTISNIWLALSGTKVTGSADAPGINFTDNQSNIGTIPSGGSANNSSDPMEFEISPSFTNAVVTFTLHVVGNGGTYSQDLVKEAWVGRPDILIVDDDSSTVKYNDYESYYTNALDSLRLLYSVWDKTTQGEPAFSFSNYKILIWYTGDHRTSIFSQAEVESLTSFLDNGGRLFLTSQDAAEALAGSGDPLDSTFLTDYLHCQLDNDSAAQRQVMGVPQDTIGDTLYIYLAGTGSPQNQISKDILLPDSSAIPVLNYTGSNWTPVDGVAGLRYQGAYKLVFFGFGFEGMNQTTYPYQGHYLPRSHFVMQRVMDWLKTDWLYVNGDANHDGTVNSADVAYLINYLFVGGPAPQPMAAGDANGDCVVNSADVAYLINYLFVGGPPPKPGCA
jgi:immune inhibitor A